MNLNCCKVPDMIAFKEAKGHIDKWQKQGV